MIAATDAHALANLQYSNALQANPELKVLAEHASQVLADVLGESAGLVTAQWDLATDESGRSLILLRLTDHTGEVQGAFCQDEFSSRWHVRGRLQGLWGDLLRQQSKRLLQKFQESMDAIVSE